MPCILLEVMQFLSPSDLLLGVTTVSRYLHEIATNEALWEEFLTRLGEKKQGKSAKEAYRHLASLYLPVLTCTVLSKFDLNSLSWSQTPLSVPVKLTYFMSIARLPDCHLFVTGANRPLDTFRIHSVSGYVTPLQSLPIYRNNIGLIRHCKAIYAFGGYESVYLASCEKYNIGTGKWEALPEALSPRASFNPTVHRSWIYLIGGWSSGECEVFDTTSETFALLALTLPPNAFVCSWWDCDTLICIEKSGLYCWSEGSEQTWKCTKRAFNLGVVPWSSFKVTKYRGFLYLLEIFSCKIVKMDLRTYEHWDLQIPSLGASFK